jgi:hypothetical protein
VRTPSHKLLRAAKPCRGLVAAVLLLMALAGAAWAQEESLGDYARRIQSQKPSQVLISTEDGQRLFKQVDEITQFSSQDSGLPKLVPVKRQLIGRAEAEKHFRSESEDETQHQRRLDQTTVVLQKFGLLPANFEIKATLGNLVLNGIAGFYDDTDKTMYLLNWIDPDLQKMVMAHELTHALQDQNFQLSRFQSRRKPQPAAPQMNMEQDDSSEVPLAQRAMVEGQATVVGFDYRLKPMGVNLADSPHARQVAESILQGSYDPPVTIHNAPRLLRETMTFPYREGLQFELEVLAHGGRHEAFRETFRRPPLNTHQILQPEAYLKNEKPPQVTIGDLAPVFGRAYQAYDSGSVGEFDVQIMSEEFGRENDIYTVARKWDGGAYVAVKRAGLAADAKIATSDLALVYLSRWTTRQAAERFGYIYLHGIAKRLPMSTPDQQRCEEAKCAGPLWEEHAATSEGPVHAELWPGNLLIIAQSVDDAQMPALRSILLSGAKPLRSKSARSSAAQPNTEQARAAQPELAPRLFAMPRFQALSEQAGIQIGLALEKHFSH